MALIVDDIHISFSPSYPPSLPPSLLSPTLPSSRNGERSVSITKEEYSSQITLIGGRGYDVFIETDSRKLAVETGDRVLEVMHYS